MNMSANNRLLPSSQQMAPPNTSKVLDDDQDGVDDGQALSLIVLKDGKLMANGQPFLVDVPSNVVVTPAASSVVMDAATAGCFVGFDGSSPESWQTFSLGRLLGIRFMSIFRFKVWWTTQWVGSQGRDLEHETQFLLLDKSDDGSTTITTSRRRRPYVLILPIIEGQFRASLQPGDDDNVDVCVESGSTTVKSSTFRTSVYMHAAIYDDGDPFTLVKDAIKVVRAHLGTFRLLEEKTPPPIVDKFGWCTWDAFYLKVHPDGVLQGVKSLADGGCLPGLVLIDDGWQTILHDEDEDEDGGMNRTSAGEQMPCRLVKFEENKKFTNKGGLSSLTKELRETYGVQHVYVWHALCGYWGGVRPKSTGGVPESEVVNPLLTPGLKMTMEDLAVDKIVRNGIGLVPPEKAGDLYRGLHSHLSDVGVDGVKVDVIHLLEMLCENYGGRVDLAKSYYKALSDSVRRHFNGNGVIASMEHCNDFMLLGTETISLGRVGDDFWCTDPSGDPNGTFWLQGCHMAHCAYNSLWMGNFIHPDWDMFQSTHPCAEFHAASRAISGGPIYISDNVGEHDFRLLKSLALPDGTILRCESYALPTRDCLFSDPLHDGKTALKIWNLNKFNGVIGIFNCQGGGWCRQSRRNTSASEFSHRVKTTAKPQDVEWKSSSTSEEVFAVYWLREGKMELLKGGDGVEISLDPFNFELLTVSPVKLLPLPPTKNSNNDSKHRIKFAPIGLVNMLNTGGAIQGMEFTTTSSSSTSVRLRIKGSGELKVYSSLSPCVCCLNGEEESFCYRENVVSLQVPWLSDQPSVVEYLYY